MSNREPMLLIISSPSGAGKTTLTRRLRDAVPNLRFSVSHTTRRPREGEQTGREYHFTDREAFDRLVADERFLEWAEVHGNLYGTSLDEVRKNADARGIIFDVDHQGARQIKCMRPDAVAVFVLPPSMDILLSRLRGRASEDEPTVRRRYQAAIGEIAHYGMFDYVLVNDDLDEATSQLVSIFKAEECRRGRAARFAERLLTANRAVSSG